MFIEATGAGPLPSVGVFTGSSAIPEWAGPEGPGGGWPHRAYSYYLS